MKLTNLGVTLTLAISLPVLAADGPGLEVGDAAPNLNLPAADGTSRSLAASEGVRVLIFYRGLW